MVGNQGGYQLIFPPFTCKLSLELDSCLAVSQDIDYYIYACELRHQQNSRLKIGKFYKIYIWNFRYIVWHLSGRPTYWDQGQWPWLLPSLPALCLGIPPLPKSFSPWTVGIRAGTVRRRRPLWIGLSWEGPSRCPQSHWRLVQMWIGWRGHEAEKQST